MHRLLALALAAAGAAAAPPPGYDAEIAEAHRLAAGNRAERIASYTFNSFNPPNASVLDLGALDTAIAVLFANTNQTAMAHADAVLAATISYYWNTNASRSYGSSYQCILVRAFGLFHSRSRFVAEKRVGPMSPATEALFARFFFDFVQGTAAVYTNETDWGVEVRRDSENIDTMRRSTAYVASSVLAMDPATASKTLADGRTVAEHHTRWETFYYDWTKWFATHGLFEELGSQYWPRTWGCLFNLLELPPSARVRARAKMMVDIAMVEAEQGSLGGVRVGQKSRAKRDMSREALPFTMYVNLSPQLYGDNMTGGPYGNPFDRIINQEAGWYETANVSILVHRHGASPETGGVFTIRNRMVGEVDSDYIGMCPPKSAVDQQLCNDTGRSTPCQCAWNTIGIISVPAFNAPTPFRNNSRQVSYIHTTPSYALGGVMYDPNHFFMGGSQQRWTGLVFGNRPNFTTIGLRHLTGEKWALVDQDVMIAQKCASANYGGDPTVDLYSPQRYWQAGGWTFVESGPTPEGPAAWAAVRPAWGGDNITELRIPHNAPILSLVPTDPWAPLIIIAGRPTDFASGDAFAQAVLAAPLRVESPDWQQRTVTLGWRGRELAFFANTIFEQYQLPTVNGVPVETAPDALYSGPHLNSALGSDTVRTSYGEYVVDYDFGDDTVTRVRA